ncbi:MAG: hypothetical protein HZB68_02565 [Candidatus Aenigmarchaeota archaeon]|nr:hypothetical protein [Candidatus Aenigmarchaeota archaeon]
METIKKIEVMLVSVRHRSFLDAIGKRFYECPVKYSPPDAQHIALYQTSPISAITHICKVGKTERDEGKSALAKYHFSRIDELNPHIPLGNTSPVQGKTYLTLEKIRGAKTVADLRKARQHFR